MVGVCTEEEKARIDLRQQAHYWRALHGRAREREASWKEKAQQNEKTVRQLEGVVAALEEENAAKERENAELKQEIATLKARIAWLNQQLFGRKSEQTKESTAEDQDSDQEHSEASEDSETSEDSSNDKRKRGKQRGSKGHGRRRHPELPSEEKVHELPESERFCPCCGKPFAIFPDTEDSEEIHWDYLLVRIVHRRVRYIRTCDCPELPRTVTAPVPPKLIPKGMFTVGFWVRLLMEKYLFQRPLYRVLQMLELEGLFLSQGTITGGLKRIGELVQPLYTRILERSRGAKHWHMDETRWSVFVEVAGKIGYRWWLWVVVTRDTCAYLLDPSRSAEVPKKHLGEDPEGIISADRYAVYKVLGDKIRVAFCWGHVRRDFVRIRDGYKNLRSWGEAWVTRINDIFAQNAKRLEVLSNPEEFAVEDKALRTALDAMVEQRESELADSKLDPAPRKALESMRNHWEGLMLFVEYPEIPMDNNESERRLRNPVVGRKNYYGSGSVWSGMLAAILFTIFQTLLLNHIDPQKFLLSYFEACARAGGRAPENIDDFLPWNLSEEQKAAWRYPERPP